ncbi:MAG TPA: SCP2 sterol-binding domain-containing protein, partial [Candidatus Dormibacteraeota bacterium]|nr:SCP2 sterol-binding domain-containing protein [Candidatus Dormibacteraeota bacterium]
AGADDAGVVSLDRDEVADQRGGILAAFPRAATLISFVCRMNRDNIRTPARSIANLEFHHAGDHVDEVARRVVAELEARGVRAMNGGAMGFPMEIQNFPQRMWVVAHKPVAIAAGLGRMGIHRNVIHPRLGSFILLGTVVVDVAADAESRPVDYNPCLECKLCVAACPTGAIGADGHFDFTACYTHNYREFMGGFNDWVEQIAESGSRRGYRERVTAGESASMWQSLSFGANYKAAYCLSVCPAGSDVIAPFLTERPRYLDEVVRPLQDRGETVYVVAGSDAEAHVARRFPRKRTRRVGNGLRPTSIATFVGGLPIAFQRGRSDGLAAVYHLSFTGDEERAVTVEIRDRTLTVSEGHLGRADLRVTADSRTWLRMLAGETAVVWALLRRRIRLRGNPRLLLAFSRCFPS